MWNDNGVPEAVGTLDFKRRGLWALWESESEELN